MTSARGTGNEIDLSSLKNNAAMLWVFFGYLTDFLRNLSGLFTDQLGLKTDPAVHQVLQRSALLGTSINWSVK